MKSYKSIVLFLLTWSIEANAQERSIVYSNLLNPFAYNPALAGSNDNISALFNTRGVLGGIDGTWRSYNFGIHAPLKNGNGIGIKFISSSVGVFQTINAEGVFSKTVKLNSKSNLSLGLSAGITQTNLKADMLNKMVDLSDPMLSSTDLNKLLFSSGLGLLYKFDKKAELGLSFPALMTGDKPLNDMMVLNAGWNFYGGAQKEWKVKPMLNYYKLNSSPQMIDGLLQGSWKETVSLAAGYRTNSCVIIMAGINFKSFAVNYAYYSYTSGIKALAPTENEISISFGFNKPSKTASAASSEQAVQDEIDRINTKLNELMGVEKTNPGLVDMKKELSKLNKDLVKVLSRYKINNPEQIQKIRSLQGTIESIIAKYND